MEVTLVIDTERKIIDIDRARERSSEAIGVVDTIANEDADYEVADLVQRRSTHQPDAITVKDCKEER